MFKIHFFSLFVALFVCSTAQAQITFLEGKFSTIAAIAKQERKPFMIYFYSTSCHACKRMDSTFSDKSIVDYADARYIAYKVDGLSLADGGIDVAYKLGVTSFPTIMFYTADASPIYEVDGYLTPENLLGNMKTEWDNAQKGGTWCAAHASHWIPQKQKDKEFCEITYPANFKFDSEQLNQEIAAEMSGKKPTEKPVPTEMYASRGADRMVAKSIDKPQAIPRTQSKPLKEETITARVSTPVTRSVEERDAQQDAYDISKFPKAKYAVQILAASNKTALQQKIQNLEAEGEKQILTAKTVLDGKTYYKLMLGQYETRAQAEKRCKELGAGYVIGLAAFR